MERSLQGDSCAYQELLVLLTVALRNLIRSRARASDVETEDLVQEVLLALHLKRSTWVSGTPVAPWVAAIARNKLVDAFRRRGQRTLVSIDELVESLAVDAQDDEQVHDLEHLLAQLSERQQSVVRAVSLEGYSAREAAAQLRMTEGAVRVTLHRSLKNLAALMRKSRNAY
jgi:RNA polymerase sigma-70 factor (ECF subfamily)